MEDLPDAHDPHDQQAGVGQQRDHRPEERPEPVDAVVGVQHADSFARRKRSTSRSSLARKCLDDADAGDRVGQHARHFGPGPAGELEPAPQPAADPVDDVGDHRQRHERGKGQLPIDAQQNDRRHQEHQHVVDKIQQIYRQEVTYPVRVGADPRDQVASALAAEILQRHALQMRVQVQLRRSTVTRSLTQAMT